MDSRRTLVSITAPEDITAAQMRAGRALLDWSRPQAAEACGVAIITLSRLETGQRLPTQRVMSDIVEAFSRNGVDFVDFDGRRGVVLRSPLASTTQ